MKTSEKAYASDPSRTRVCGSFAGTSDPWRTRVCVPFAGEHAHLLDATDKVPPRVLHFSAFHSRPLANAVMF